MPVHTVPSGPLAPASFIVCDKRSDINRVPVSAARLAQWRCDAGAVRGFIAMSLGLRLSDLPHADAGLLNIGIASGDKRSQMLCLRTERDLILVAGNNGIPLPDLVGFPTAAIRWMLARSANWSIPRPRPIPAIRRAMPNARRARSILKRCTRAGGKHIAT